MNERIYIFLLLIGIFMNTALHSQHTLVLIQTINPNILLDIRYATTNNFTGTVLYESAECYIQHSTALKLDAVQKELEERGLGLKVWDAYRPHSIQYKLWEIVPIEGFVGNPEKGSKHNRGAAVDLTLVDAQGNELEMPTEFDNFTSKAHSDYSDDDISQTAINNRELLKEVMIRHGFEPLPTEWWHFNDTDWKQFDILNIPFCKL